MTLLLIEIEGYRARLERDRDGMIHGRVIDMENTINFKAPTQRLVERNFARAIQAYFERCKHLGIKPHKPLTGF